MNYTVRLTDTANQDLREIAFQIVVKSKDRVIAKCFVGEVRETCRKLDTFPNAEGIPKDRIIRSAEVRFIVHKEYLILYLVDEEGKQVNVMAIVNAKKDYMRVMKKFI